MRLGTSGLGVIAAVSLLVTAAPERNGGDVRNREGRIDYSRNSVSPPDSGDKKGNARIEKSLVHEDKTEPTSGFIREAESSQSQDRSADPIDPQPNVNSSTAEPPRNVEKTDDREDRNFRRFADDSRIVKPANVSAMENRWNGGKSISGRDGSFGDSTAVGGRETTPKTRIEAGIGDRIGNSLGSGAIGRKSLPDVATIGTASLRYEKTAGNRSAVDVDLAGWDSLKAIRARSFQTTNAATEKSADPAASSLSSRSPPNSAVKAVKSEDGALVARKINSPSHAINQAAFARSAVSAVGKNGTKASINLLEGESSKIFYEIKPSLITDMDRNDDLDHTTITTTRRSFDKFLLPSVPSALGKFGPYFLDEEDQRNVTERIGNTVQLDCRIGMLGHRKVTWLQHYKDSFRLLTVERESYSVDQRISLNFQYPDNWRLQIAYASFRDSGLYKCQVEIDHDKLLMKRYNVIITAPNLTITDDSGRPVSGERHLKAGSALKLRCEARDVLHGLNESVLWMRGDETLTDDVSENRTTEIINEKEITVVISTLLIERAVPRHAGNYSCVVPDKARTTIAVHVLNGELPAAVQHGSGVSTAVLNIWLVHLTASYGFFR